MSEIDAVRVRVLLENLCELEPRWFWRTESGSRIDAKSGLGAVSVARIHVNGKPTIYSESIRDALEALHDARGWAVTIYTGTYGIDRSSRCEIAISQPVWRDVRHTAPTRLEAMLEATNTALGGAL